MEFNGYWSDRLDHEKGFETVVRVAFDHSYRFSQRQSQSWSLLVQLSGAHDGLVAEMENLDRMTLGPLPDRAVLTTGRWRIGQASLRRRTLASRTFDFLADQLEGMELQRLREIQTADQDMMRRSAAHVGNWTMQTICRNWAGYCEASRHIRAHMKAHIQLERQSLYPLLERLAERGA